MSELEDLELQELEEEDRRKRAQAAQQTQQPGFTDFSPAAGMVPQFNFSQLPPPAPPVVPPTQFPPPAPLPPGPLTTPVPPPATRMVPQPPPGMSMMDYAMPGGAPPIPMVEQQVPPEQFGPQLVPRTMGDEGEGNTRFGISRRGQAQEGPAIALGDYLASGAAAAETIATNREILRIATAQDMGPNDVIPRMRVGGRLFPGGLTVAQVQEATDRIDPQVQAARERVQGEVANTRAEFGAMRPWYQNPTIGGALTDLAETASGTVVGFMQDPINAISTALMPLSLGETVPARLATGFGLNAAQALATNPVTQAAQIATGTRDEFSPGEWLVQGLLGGAMGAGFVGTHALAQAAGRRILGVVKNRMAARLERRATDIGDEEAAAAADQVLGESDVDMVARELGIGRDHPMYAQLEARLARRRAAEADPNERTRQAADAAERPSTIVGGRALSDEERAYGRRPTPVRDAEGRVVGRRPGPTTQGEQVSRDVLETRARVEEQDAAAGRPSWQQPNAPPTGTQVFDETGRIIVTPGGTAIPMTRAQQAGLAPRVEVMTPEARAIAESIRLRGDTSRNLPAVVEPQPRRMTPDEITAAQRGLDAGTPNRAEPVNLRVEEGRAPLRPEDVQGQREAGEAFDVAAAQRQRSEAAVTREAMTDVPQPRVDPVAGGRMEGPNRQEVLVVGNQPVREVGRSQGGRILVEPYDVRTGEAVPGAHVMAVAPEHIEVMHWTPSERMAQDVTERARAPRTDRGPGTEPMAGPQGMATQDIASRQVGGLRGEVQGPAPRAPEPPPVRGEAPIIEGTAVRTDEGAPGVAGRVENQQFRQPAPEPQPRVAPPRPGEPAVRVESGAEPPPPPPAPPLYERPAAPGAIRQPETTRPEAPPTTTAPPGFRGPPQGGPVQRAGRAEAPPPEPTPQRPGQPPRPPEARADSPQGELPLGEPAPRGQRPPAEPGEGAPPPSEGAAPRGTEPAPEGAGTGQRGEGASAEPTAEAPRGEARAAEQERTATVENPRPTEPGQAPEAIVAGREPPMKGDPPVNNNPNDFARTMYSLPFGDPRLWSWMWRTMTSPLRWAAESARKTWHDMQAAGRDLQASTQGSLAQQTMSTLEIKRRLITQSAISFIRGTAARFESGAVQKIADMIEAVAGEHGRATGRSIIESQRLAAGEHGNRFWKAAEEVLGQRGLLERLTPGKLRALGVEVGEMLRLDRFTNDAKGRFAQEVRNLLDDLHQYQRDAGVEVGRVRSGYLERRPDLNWVAANQGEFLAAAERAYRHDGMPAAEAKQAALGWYERLRMNELGLHGGSDLAPTTAGVGGKPNVTRAREFSPGAERILDNAGVYNNNVFELIPDYIRQTTRRAELVRRFGDDMSGYTKLRDQAYAEGVPVESFAAVTREVRSALGLTGAQGGSGVAAGFRSAGSVMMMGKALLSSLLDWALPVIHSNRLLASSATSISDILTQGGMSLLRDTAGRLIPGLKNLAGPARIDATRAMAEEVGMIVRDMDQLATMAHGDVASGRPTTAVGRGLKWSENMVYAGNLLTGWTNSVRVASLNIALSHLQRLSREIMGEGRVLGVIPADKAQSAAGFLRELGVPDTDHRALAQHVLDSAQNGDLRTLPPEGHPMREHMVTALNRFLDHTVINPTAGQKPGWMSTPVGRVASQFSNFAMGMWENVTKRALRMFRQASDFSQTRSFLERAELAKPLMAMPLLGYGNYLLWDWKRNLYRDPARQQRPENEPSVAEGVIASNTVMFGGLDRLRQVWSAMTRHGASGVGLVAGPAPGSLYDTGAALAQAASDYYMHFTGRSTSESNTNERNAVRALYNTFGQGMLNAGLALLPRPLSLPGMLLAGHPAAREAVVSGVAGPPAWQERERRRQEREGPGRRPTERARSVDPSRRQERSTR